MPHLAQRDSARPGLAGLERALPIWEGRTVDSGLSERAVARDHLGWLLYESGPRVADHTILLLPGALCTAAFYDELIAEPSLRDRKSTRLNSSHTVISYAVFCLKKKKKKNKNYLIKKKKKTKKTK